MSRPAIDLAYWINEREAMRHRRMAGAPPPWTNDPAMGTVRYCNVHREHDKVTQYIRNSRVYSGAAVPVGRVVLARMLNRITTLALVESAAAVDDWQEVKFRLYAARARGEKIWGNAYTISTCGKAMDKVDYVIDHVVSEVHDAEKLENLIGGGKWGTLNAAFNWLTELDGLGSFLAAQVVADLKNTPGHPLATAPDWHYFCAPGPGSLKGLTAYYGRPSTPGTFAKDIDQCYAEVMPLVANYVGEIHMQDFQNCLCEFSKFERVKHGGKARNNYDPFNKS